jgi:hypothetical protein
LQIEQESERDRRGSGRIIIWLLPMTLLAAVASGCDRGPATAQVRGKVVYSDGSVPEGGVRVVRFEPTSDSKAEVRKGASGEIQDDGTFEMYTRRPGDGVYLGQYAVTFAIYKSPIEPITLIPMKYTASTTTPFRITVDRNRDDLLYEIEK